MIVATVYTKGGTGKTTTCLNLSITRARKGRDVLLVDSDEGGSASFVLAIRDEAEISPRVTNVQKFGRGLAAEVRALSQKYQDVFIDAGGKSNDEIAGALMVADVAIIPMQASQLDLYDLVRMSAMIENARVYNPQLVARALITRASTNPSVRDVDETIEFLNDFPAFGRFDTVIRERLSVRRSVASGLSIFEYTPSDPKAMEELDALYGEVFGND